MENPVPIGSDRAPRPPPLIPPRMGEGDDCATWEVPILSLSKDEDREPPGAPTSWFDKLTMRSLASTRSRKRAP